MSGGWAILDRGKILIETVSSSRRAAIVNWLVVVPRHMVTRSDTDAEIERAFETLRLVMESGAEPVQITVVKAPKASVESPLYLLAGEQNSGIGFNSIDNLASQGRTDDPSELAKVGATMLLVGCAIGGNTVTESRDFLRRIFTTADKDLSHQWDALRKIPLKEQSNG